jgi:ferrous iron transport protein B
LKQIILVGQPNCGKSTIFNYVVGYKSVASNFPGITVKYTKGNLTLDNEEVEIIDLPGTYSLQTTDEAEYEAVKYLMDKAGKEDTIIVNVLDASVLSRSLELTLQLLELEMPMVVCLNMYDEAEKKGNSISLTKLSAILGVRCLKTIGKKGTGVYELFSVAGKASKPKANPISYAPIIEKTIRLISTVFTENNLPEKWNYRFMAIKLFEKDKSVSDFINEHLSKEETEKIRSYIDTMQKMLEEDSESLISSARHSASLNIFEQTVKVGSRKKKDFREKIDDVLMHPLFGYVSLAAILAFSFWIIFKIGNFAEPFFIDNFDNLSQIITGYFGEGNIISSVFTGFLTGFGAGIAIVIPYLLPFFILLSFLEDTGYLARVAFLTDNLMHRIGLHGLSVVPMIFGYGCTVPAIFATKILKSPRDKFITATLTTLVPCSARMTVIFGLVGFFISIKAAILIYIFNIIIIGILGRFISKAFPEVSPGLVLEIPKYHMPSFRALINKTWFRLKEFVTIALPLLIVGSIILEIINFLNFSAPINSFLSPFTVGILGLPVAVGITLIFGILRKELALILLFAALGTQNIASVMTTSQILTFTVFITFYIPCLSTYAALARELSHSKALLITGFSVLLAIVLSVIVRLVFSI